MRTKEPQNSSIAGLGIGTVWTNSDALVSALAVSTKLGASIGAAQSFKEFGDMVGALAVGLLAQFYRVRVGFVTSGLLALLFVLPMIRSRSLRHTELEVSVDSMIDYLIQRVSSLGPWRYVVILTS